MLYCQALQITLSSPPALNLTAIIMSKIFAIHGVARRPRPETFVYRSYFASRALKLHLRKRTNRYVSLDMALSGQGDALTIDDATSAGFEAAILARKYGHEVTLFINPHNVIDRTPYFMNVLDMALDKTRRSEIMFNERRFLLDSFNAKLSLRKELKSRLMKLTTEPVRTEFVQRLAVDLDVPDLSVPEHLRVISLEEILVLRDMGVSIANHGWTHGAIEALDPSVARDEIIKAKKWIAQECRITASAYAVPFGNALPPFEISDDVCGVWFLLNFNSKPGFVGPNVFNRESLDVRN